MKHPGFKLTYGMRDGKATHISEVPSGLACNCTCPACGAALVAKKRQITMHHFAHHACETCTYGYEASLHLAAKEILSASSEMMIPYVKLPLDIERNDVTLYPAQKITLDKVEVEQRTANMIPGLIVYSYGRKLYIKISATHFMDERKKQELKQQRISIIEIDLSSFNGVISEERLRNILVEKTDNKKWLYNSAAARKQKEFLSFSETIPTEKVGKDVYTTSCPLQKRVRNGHSTAYIFYDCEYCKYCFGIDKRNKYVKCNAKSGVHDMASLLKQAQRK